MLYLLSQEMKDRKALLVKRAQGIQGETGPIGPQGEKGDQGDPGPEKEKSGQLDLKVRKEIKEILDHKESQVTRNGRMLQRA